MSSQTFSPSSPVAKLEALPFELLLQIAGYLAHHDPPVQEKCLVGQYLAKGDDEERSEWTGKVWELTPSLDTRYPGELLVSSFQVSDLLNLGMCHSRLQAVCAEFVYRQPNLVGNRKEGLPRFLHTIKCRRPELQSSVTDLAVSWLRSGNSGPGYRGADMIKKYLRPNLINLTNLRALDIENHPSDGTVYLSQWCALLPHFPALRRLSMRGFRKQLSKLLPRLPQVDEAWFYNCTVPTKPECRRVIACLPNIRTLVNFRSFRHLPENALDEISNKLETCAWLVPSKNMADCNKGLRRFTKLKHLKIMDLEAFLQGNFVNFSDTLETLELVRGPASMWHHGPLDQGSYTRLRSLLVQLATQCAQIYTTIRIVDLRRIYADLLGSHPSIRRAMQLFRYFIEDNFLENGSQLLLRGEDKPTLGSSFRYRLPVPSSSLTG